MSAEQTNQSGSNAHSIPSPDPFVQQQQGRVDQSQATNIGAPIQAVADASVKPIPEDQMLEIIQYLQRLNFQKQLPHSGQHNDRALRNWDTFRRRTFNFIHESGLSNHIHDYSDLDEKTKTALGAFLANYVGNPERIGSVDHYMGDRKTEGTPHYNHLREFYETGAHAFITPLIHQRISGSDKAVDFGGWGRDANFVSTKKAADAMIEKHSKKGGRGIFGLEDDLGVPEGQWVSQCTPDFIMYRYIITDHDKLDALNIRIPSGYESQAYGSWWKGDTFVPGQWRPKGFTEGGQKEAVIDALSRYDNQDVFDQRSPFFTDMVDIEVTRALRYNTIRVIWEENRDKKTFKRQ